MAITKCKACGKDVSILAVVCPHCGQLQPGSGSPQEVLNSVKEGFSCLFVAAAIITIPIVLLSSGPVGILLFVIPVTIFLGYAFWKYENDKWKF